MLHILNHPLSSSEFQILTCLFSCTCPQLCSVLKIGDNAYPTTLIDKPLCFTENGFILIKKLRKVLISTYKATRQLIPKLAIFIQTNSLQNIKKNNVRISGAWGTSHFVYAVRKHKQQRNSSCNFAFKRLSLCWTELQFSMLIFKFMDMLYRKVGT